MSSLEEGQSTTNTCKKCKKKEDNSNKFTWVIIIMFSAIFCKWAYDALTVTEEVTCHAVKYNDRLRHHYTGYDWSWHSNYEVHVKVETIANYIGYTSSSPLYVTITETMQLLDTFAIKNVAINGIDFGGHIDAVISGIDLTDGDKALGFLNLPLTLYMDIDVANTTAFGASGEPIAYPDAFDYRTANPGCMPAVLNQGTCNCCWALLHEQICK